MSSFSLDLSRFVTKAKGSADKVVRKVVMDIGARVVLKSPVGDADYWQSPPPPGYVGGRFRGNWQMGEGQRPAGDLPDIDPTGAASLERIAGGLNQNAAGKVFFLVNNLPYAMRIEDGTASPRQAPNGVVRTTLLEFQAIVTKAANEGRS